MVWTYVQPAGSQRSPCVGRCTRAPARCACWRRSGPGPLAAQDRPPQSPPPRRTALLCSSSSGPGAASRARGGAVGRRAGGRAGGQTQGQGAKTGVETVTEIGMVSTWGRHIWGGGEGGIRVDRHMPASGIRGVGSGQSGWRNAPPSQRRGG